MERDYHYYAVYQLAKLAGFNKDDSETIAYANQYVDDSTESEPIEITNDQHFDTVRTAHYNLEAFSWDVQKKIYIPFHFLPDQIRWKSPQSFSYITSQATKNKNKVPAMLFYEALNESEKTFRLIRIGIALHGIADTFSHFGFSGRHHKENDVGGIWHKKNGSYEIKLFEGYIADIFVPRIGHVEAFQFPDQPFLNWKYEDNSGKEVKRDNAQESIKGAKLIYQFLKIAKNGSDVSANLAREYPEDFKTIKSLFRSNGDLYNRCKKWRDYTKAPKYNKTAWRKDALQGNVMWDDLSRSAFKDHAGKLKGKKGFEKSKWAFFHRAALKQRNLVLSWLN